MIEVEKIRIDGGTQSRAAINEQTVAEYAEAMEDETTVFPPIVVYHDGRDHWLADGFHRLEAWKRIGRTEVPAEIRQGDRRRAILHSCAANAAHGLRRTNDDKRRAVMTLLEDEEWGQWSNREIARRCGVHYNFVGKLRADVTITPSDSEAPRTYTTKHGTEAQMDTSRIGKAEAKTDSIPSETEGATTADLDNVGDGSRGSRLPSGRTDGSSGAENAAEEGDEPAAGGSPAPEPQADLGETEGHFDRELVEPDPHADLRKEFRALTREAQEDDWIALRLTVVEQKGVIREQTHKIADLKADMKALLESSDLGPVVSRQMAEIARLKDARNERQAALAKETRRANLFEAKVKKLEAELQNRVEVL